MVKFTKVKTGKFFDFFKSVDKSISVNDTLSSEFYTRVNVGIGTAVVGVKDLARSFKEAQMALEVGKVFDTDKAIVSYENLGEILLG